jgi:hypothetical protein
MVIQEILGELWNSFLANLFPFTISVLWLVIGFIIGKIVGKIVKEILSRIKLDEYIIESEKIKLKLSDAFSMLFKWVIYFIFIIIAADALGIQVIIDLVSSVIEFLIGIIKASIILLVGYSLAGYLKDKVIQSKTLYGEVVGQLVFFLIIYISISAALPLVGIERLTELTDRILLIIVSAVALGVAIALGLGLKPFVEEMAKKYSKRFR